VLKARWLRGSWFWATRCYEEFVVIEACRQSAIKVMNSMNDTSELPYVLVASSTTANSDRLSRVAPVIRKHTMHGAAVMSCHWGSPNIIVDVPSFAGGPRSPELAVLASELLQTAGLTQSDTRAERSDSRNALGSLNVEHPPVIHVSIPGHFGVELSLLVGAALRPLQNRQVVLVGLCGGIDAALRERFDTASLEALVRYANQLPKHRTADIYPLFSLIGARSGISLGILDRVITDSASSKRELSIVSPARPLHTRVPYELDAGELTTLSARR
jgi:hypothetical protein